MFPQTPHKVQPKKENPECKLKIKRNREGKIVGMSRTGKCTKEDMLVFAKENNIDLE